MRETANFAGRATAVPTWDRPLSLFTVLLGVQGAYYFLTGVWPLVSIETFLMVTGPKTDHLQSPNPTPADHWLVMTVGVLVAAIGATLLAAAWRRSNFAELAVLAVLSAVGLTAVDVIYVSREVLPPIYLADAAGEVVLLVGWLTALVRHPGQRGHPATP